MSLLAGPPSPPLPFGHFLAYPPPPKSVVIYGQPLSRSWMDMTYSTQLKWMYVVAYIQVSWVECATPQNTLRTELNWMPECECTNTFNQRLLLLRTRWGMPRSAPKKRRKKSSMRTWWFSPWGGMWWESKRKNPYLTCNRKWNSYADNGLNVNIFTPNSMFGTSASK